MIRWRWFWKMWSRWNWYATPTFSWSNSIRKRAEFRTKHFANIVVQCYRYACPLCVICLCFLRAINDIMFSKLNLVSMSQHYQYHWVTKLLTTWNKFFWEPSKPIMKFRTFMKRGISSPSLAIIVHTSNIQYIAL
jgi:hypothetical protein